MKNLHFIPNNILIKSFKELTKYKDDYQYYLNYIYKNYRGFQPKSTILTRELMMCSKNKKHDLSSEFKKLNQGNTNGYINTTIK